MATLVRYLRCIKDYLINVFTRRWVQELPESPGQEQEAPRSISSVEQDFTRGDLVSAREEVMPTELSIGAKVSQKLVQAYKISCNIEVAVAVNQKKGHVFITSEQINNLRFENIRMCCVSHAMIDMKNAHAEHINASR